MTDDPTLNFYNQHADNYIEQTRNVKMNALHYKFTRHLPTHLETPQHILDFGCGSGRDSFCFSNKLGMKVTAIDGSSELIKRNQAYYATSNVDWRHLNFDELRHQGWQNEFTGIWACASLLHIPFNDLPTIMIDLINTLVSDGVIYASFKYGDGERWDGSRFFCDMNEERWLEVLQRVGKGCTLEYFTWITTDQRVDREDDWFNVLLTKRG